MYYKIFKNISPEGFILKNEIEDREFLKKGIITILNQGNIYSETITKFLKKTANQKFLLDDIDREILYLLAKNIQLKNLIHYIPLSMSGIELRKRNLLKLFNLSSSDNSSLIKAVKNNGLI